MIRCLLVYNTFYHSYYYYSRETFIFMYNIMAYWRFHISPCESYIADVWFLTWRDYITRIRILLVIWHWHGPWTSLVYFGPLVNNIIYCTGLSRDPNQNIDDKGPGTIRISTYYTIQVYIMHSICRKKLIYSGATIVVAAATTADY